MTPHTIGCDCFECKHPYIAKLHQKYNKANVVGPAGRIDYKDKGMDNFAKDFVVEWNTEPILANPLTFWSDWWSAKTWIDWHKKVKAKYGQARANEVLIQWWEKAPFASPTIDYRSFDQPFIKYAKAEGFYDALFSGLGGLIGKTASTANQTVNAVSDVVGSAGNAIEDVGNITSTIVDNIKYILIFAAVAAVIYVVLQFKKL